MGEQKNNFIGEDTIRERFREEIADQCVFNIYLDEFDYKYGLKLGTSQKDTVEIVEDIAKVKIDTENPQNVLDFVDCFLNPLHFPLNLVSTCQPSIDLYLKYLDVNTYKDSVEFKVRVFPYKPWWYNE